MKKVIRGFIFLVLIIFLILTLNYRYKNSEYYRSIYGLFRYESVPMDLDIVNFGSSENIMAVDFNIIPERKTFNFALHGQYLTLDERLLNSYKENFSDDTVVILPASFFTPYYDNELTDTVKGVYYRILDIDQIPDLKIADLLLYRYFPLLSSKENVFESFSSLEYEELTFSELDAKVEDEFLLEHAEEYGQTYLNERIKDATPNAECDASYHRILDLCKENGWKPVLLTVPVHKYYREQFPEDILALFYEYVDGLLQEYPDAIYLDYSTDGRFYTNNSLYYDSDHLNQDGRTLFTQILYDDLIKYGLFQ